MFVKRRRLPFTGLRALEAYARTGRMTLAAAELGVTHGAVSRALKGLEQDLGYPLMERNRGRSDLNAGGLRLAKAMTCAFDDIAAALDEQDRAKTVLRVSCISSFAARWLIPRLAGFSALHPDIDVQIHESNSLIRLPEPRVDVAVRMVDNDTYPGADGETFLESWHGPVIAPSITPADPSAVWALARLATRTYPPAWLDWQRDASIDWPAPETTKEFDRFIYTLEAALGGLGVALAPMTIVGDDIAAGRLTAPFGFVKSRARYVFFRRSSPGSTATDVFCDWIKTEAARFDKEMSAGPQHVI